MKKKLAMWMVVVLSVGFLIGCGTDVVDMQDEQEFQQGDMEAFGEDAYEEDQGAFEEEQDATAAQYEIVTEVYEEGSVVVQYPQIQSMEDEQMQASINEMIMNGALIRFFETMNFLEEGQDYEAEGTYEVKFAGNNLLSIAFDTYHFVSDTAHPYSLIYTMNIDLVTGEFLELRDLVPQMDASFATLLREATYVGDLDAEYEDQIRQEAFGYFETDEDLLVVLTDNGDQNNVYAYVTGDALGITMPVPYVMGDHVEFEIDAAMLEGQLIVVE